MWKTAIACTGSSLIANFKYIYKVGLVSTKEENYFLTIEGLLVFDNDYLWNVKQMNNK